MKRIIHPLVYLTVISVFYTGFLTMLVYRFVPQKQNITSNAAGNPAQIYLLPSSNTMNGETVFQLWVNSNGYPFDFIHSEIVFNNAVLKLSREVVYQSTLQKLIKLTTMQEANNTGNITLVAGLDPQIQNRNSPPAGSYHLANLYFTPATTQNNLTTSISVNNQTAKIVAPDTSLFTVTTNGSTVTINPISPTNTPVLPTSTPRPSYTPTPTTAINPTVIQPTPTTSQQNCISLCLSKGYTSSACRKSVQQCVRHKEYNIMIGNGYCPNPTNNVCCCK